MPDQRTLALGLAARRLPRGLLRDEHPGRPRLLFVGYGESSHTHSWIDLLRDAEFNVRLFALPSGSPPADWWAPTFATSRHAHAMPGALYADDPVRRLAKRAASKAAKTFTHEPFPLEEMWLARVIRAWRPHVVHTLGLDAAGLLYLGARRRHRLEGIGTWVLQLRGGSDLALTHLDPDWQPRLREAFAACDIVLSDNELNFELAEALGLDRAKISPLVTVPGTGGIDVGGLRAQWQGLPSQRRAIVWPKAFEAPWSKALPVFEALRIAWPALPRCEVHLLAMHGESRHWFRTLPAEIRAACRTADRIPRAELLELMTRARVMLAPSLVDGTPNSLFEAMASGAIPIVSPLPTIAAIVREPDNVLFARNLYPDEIAGALVRAMTDDALVDAIAARNAARVRELADRATIGPRVVELYERLAASSVAETNASTPA
jgi:glycosyltransferase involved in cell wall biosynthesis